MRISAELIRGFIKDLRIVAETPPVDYVRLSFYMQKIPLLNILRPAQKLRVRNTYIPDT